MEVILFIFIICGCILIAGATHNLFMEIFVYSNKKSKSYSNYAVNEADYYVRKSKKSICGGGGPG